MSLYVVLHQITHLAGKATADSERSLRGTNSPPPALPSSWKPVAGAEKVLPLLLTVPVLLKVGAGADPKVGARVDPKVGAGVDPKVGAGVDPKVGAGVDPKVGAGVDPKVGAGVDPKVGAGVDTLLLLHIFGQVIKQEAAVLTSSLFEWQS